MQHCAFTVYWRPLIHPVLVFMIVIERSFISLMTTISLFSKYCCITFQHIHFIIIIPLSHYGGKTLIVEQFFAYFFFSTRDQVLRLLLQRGIKCSAVDVKIVIECWQPYFRLEYLLLLLLFGVSEFEETVAIFFFNMHVRNYFLFMNFKRFNDFILFTEFKRFNWVNPCKSERFLFLLLFHYS